MSFNSRKIHFNVKLVASLCFLMFYPETENFSISNFRFRRVQHFRTTTSSFDPPRTSVTHPSACGTSLTFSSQTGQKMDVFVNNIPLLIYLSKYIKWYWKISKDIESYRKISKDIKSYRKLSKVIESYRKISKVIERYRKKSKDIERNQKISKEIKRNQKISKDIKRYTFHIILYDVSSSLSFKIMVYPIKCIQQWNILSKHHKKDQLGITKNQKHYLPIYSADGSVICGLFICNFVQDEMFGLANNLRVRMRCFSHFPIKSYNIWRLHSLWGCCRSKRSRRRREWPPSSLKPLSHLGAIQAICDTHHSPIVIFCFQNDCFL